MVQGRKRLDFSLEQPVNQSVVEFEPTGIDGPGAGRLDAGPGNGESVRRDAERCDQVEVGFEAVVMIAGDLAVGAVRRRAGAEAELVPDGWALAVGARRAFDLESELTMFRESWEYSS